MLAAILVAAAQLMLFVFAPFERGGHIDFARSRLLYTMWRSPFGERVISNNYSKQALPEAWMNDDAPAWLNEQQDASGYFRQESGWPFRAFVAQLRYEPYEDRVLSIQDWNLHRTSRPKLLNGEPALFLPSRILWPGLAVDVALVPLAMVIIELSWRKAIRLKRARRGQCVRCGYSFTGLSAATCPECGDPLPATQSSQ